jgi:hypothetical protein
MKPDTLVPTRQSLHAIAELLLAGPQYRLSGTIRLRIRPGGFGTVSEPALRIDGDQLVHGEHRVTASGVSLARLAEAAGVAAGAPAGLYPSGSGAALGDPVSLDPAAARHLAECFAIGDAALRRLDPAQQPVLWPEHFDVAITLDEVNYGVSPGDSYLAEPYAYVGPWRPRTGDFWNAPFGAARPLRELGGAEPNDGGSADVERVLAFFTEGREREARS